MKIILCTAVTAERFVYRFMITLKLRHLYCTLVHYYRTPNLLFLRDK